MKSFIDHSPTARQGAALAGALIVTGLPAMHLEATGDALSAVRMFTVLALFLMLFLALSLRLTWGHRRLGGNTLASVAVSLPFCLSLVTLISVLCSIILGADFPSPLLVVAVMALVHLGVGLVTDRVCARMVAAHDSATVEG